MELILYPKALYLCWLVKKIGNFFLFTHLAVITKQFLVLSYEHQANLLHALNFARNHCI